MMKESSKESGEQITTSRNNTPRRVACQQTQSVRAMAIGTEANLKRI